MKSARIGIKPLFASNDFGVRQTDQLLQYLFVVLAKKIGSSVSSANRHAVETPIQFRLDRCARPSRKCRRFGAWWQTDT
jgi:hypothetical protein